MVNGSTSFWDASVWHSIIQIGILMLILLVGNMLRRKIGFIRRSLLPTAVIGGFIVFGLKFYPPFANLIDTAFMEGLTYHTLGLGFICMALKMADDKTKSSTSAVVNTGILTVNTYLIQAIVGGITTLILSATIMATLFPASGLLLPMGFGQGPGQALNFGKVYEELGFDGGVSFGLSVASVGFICACLIGVIAIRILVHKGKIVRAEAISESKYVSEQEVSNPNEIPLSESVDKLTMQVVMVVGIYFVTYLLMKLASDASVKYLGKFGANTLRPLIWGFNFLFGTIVAIAFKGIMSVLTKGKLMKHQYPNNFLLNRICGLMFDIMIISGVASIEVYDISKYLLPFGIICVLGTIVTYVYLLIVCKKLYPGYAYQMFFAMFGMLTGTASTGMILLREVDPTFETPAANNLVLQNVPAMLFGFPLMLLVPAAGQSWTNALMVAGVCIVMFIIYNIVLFRQFIFKNKKKGENAEPAEVAEATETVDTVAE